MPQIDPRIIQLLMNSPPSPLDMSGGQLVDSRGGFNQVPVNPFLLRDGSLPPELTWRENMGRFGLRPYWNDPGMNPFQRYMDLPNS